MQGMARRNPFTEVFGRWEAVKAQFNAERYNPCMPVEPVL